MGTCASRDFSDIAVESIAEIRDISQEQKFKSDLKNYSQELNYFHILSDHYYLSEKNFYEQNMFVGGSICF
jgi:tetraacyldisaccharide-1-P 4'-kinase